MKAVTQKIKSFSFSQVLLGAILVIIAPMFVAGLFFVNSSKKVKAFLIGLMLFALIGSYISNLNWQVESSYFWFNSYNVNLTVANTILVVGQFIAGIMAKIGWTNYINRARSSTYYLVASLIFTFSSYPIIDVNYRLHTRITVGEDSVASFIKTQNEVLKMQEKYPDVDFRDLKEIMAQNVYKTLELKPLPLDDDK